MLLDNKKCSCEIIKKFQTNLLPCKHYLHNPIYLEDQDPQIKSHNDSKNTSPVFPKKAKMSSSSLPQNESVHYSKLTSYELSNKILFVIISTLSNHVIINRIIIQFLKNIFERNFNGNNLGMTKNFMDDKGRNIRNITFYILVL